MTTISIIIAVTGIIASDPEFVTRTLDCLLRVLLSFRKHEVVLVATTKVKRLRAAVGGRALKRTPRTKAKGRIS
jgi:hypothetical protein